MVLMPPRMMSEESSAKMHTQQSVLVTHESVREAVTEALVEAVEEVCMVACKCTVRTVALPKRL